MRSLICLADSYPFRIGISQSIKMILMIFCEVRSFFILFYYSNTFKASWPLEASKKTTWVALKYCLINSRKIILLKALSSTSRIIIWFIGFRFSENQITWFSVVQYLFLMLFGSLKVWVRLLCGRNCFLPKLWEKTGNSWILSAVPSLS